MTHEEFLQLQDFIYGWRHGQARVYFSSDKYFDCEFKLPNDINKPSVLSGIEVFTNVRIVSGFMISNLPHNPKVAQRIGLGSIVRMEAIDGCEPLIWQLKSFTIKNA